VARIAQAAAREAAVLAFNDVFFLIGSLACIAFVVVLAPWLMNRLRGRNPLSKELALLETMRPGNK
jgi:flagellar biogenesis protein FliO